MGFYLKKAINFGPLRINFSKSGIGLSFGTKGLRVGSGANGNYVHAGRKGLYYRKKLPDISGGDGITIGWVLAGFLIILIGVALWVVKSGIITVNL